LDERDIRGTAERSSRDRRLMSLVTRCGRCNTLFRVTPAQLEARQGQVRCGRCMHVFDARSSLRPEGPSPAASGAARAPEQTIIEPPGATDTAAAHPHSAAATAEPASAEPVGVAPGSAVTEDAAAPMTVVAAGQPELQGAAPAAEWPLPPPSKFGMWSAATAVFAVLLLLQVLFAYRAELAGRYPPVKRGLEAVCGLLGCKVSLPQRPDLLHIEASDVQMVSASRPSLVQLTATLRSYASYDVGYPALDLVLTNANEHALARRIFLPHEYVGRDRDARAGIPPKAEITIALDLDTGDLRAAGFRVDLLPAPAL
jgi:predicted Zn finger-like uncharacterized protein